MLLSSPSMQSNKDIMPARMSIQLTCISQDGSMPRYPPIPSQQLPRAYAERLEDMRRAQIQYGITRRLPWAVARFHGGSPLCEDLVPLPPDSIPHTSQGANTHYGVDINTSVPQANGDQQAMITQMPPHAPSSHVSEVPISGNISRRPVLSPFPQTRSSVASSVTLAESIDHSICNTAGQVGSSHWTSTALREWQNSSAVHELPASATCGVQDEGKGKEVGKFRHNSVTPASEATGAFNSEDDAIPARPPPPMPKPDPFRRTSTANKSSSKGGLNTSPSVDNNPPFTGQLHNIPHTYNDSLYAQGYDTSSYARDNSFERRQFTSYHGYNGSYVGGFTSSSNTKNNFYGHGPHYRKETYVPEYSSINMFTGKRFNPKPAQAVKRPSEDQEQHERAAKQAKTQALSGSMNSTSELPPPHPDSPPQHPFVLYQWDGSGYDFVAHKKFYPAEYYRYHANKDYDANYNEGYNKSGVEQSSAAAKKSETDVYNMSDSHDGNCYHKLDAPASPDPISEDYDVVDVADVSGSDLDRLTEIENSNAAEQASRKLSADAAVYDNEDKENHYIMDDNGFVPGPGDRMALRTVEVASPASDDAGKEVELPEIINLTVDEDDEDAP
ncbi:hypothetical protein RRF57_008427 [Xylaria bambusicola]|uniref:Uncharacterized protein n=1 Tax=Xylaria bambusicola TaxID=326684 RepID=A0AAN7UN23_9PEZI